VGHGSVLVPNDEADIPIRHHTDNGAVRIDDRHEAALVIVHDPRGLGHAVARLARGGRPLHDFVDEHVLLQSLN